MSVCVPASRKLSYMSFLSLISSMFSRGFEIVSGITMCTGSLPHISRGESLWLLSLVQWSGRTLQAFADRSGGVVCGLAKSADFLWCLWIACLHTAVKECRQHFATSVMKHQHFCALKSHLSFSSGHSNHDSPSLPDWFCPVKSYLSSL